MKITVESTEAIQEHEAGFPVRAWVGTNEAGTPVVALIAGLQFPVDAPEPVELRPIPPPDPDWSTDVRLAMGAIWEVAGRLSGPEAHMLASLARSRAAYRDPACTERKCDFCHKPYRGPAVYCQYVCATADA